jgi:hypothetical protein
MVKERLALVFGFLLFLVEAALAMSGWQSQWVSLASLLVLLAVVAWAVVPAVRRTWSELGSEPRKTLYTFLACLFITVVVLGGMATHKIIHWSPEESFRAVLGRKTESDREIAAKVRDWLDKGRFKVQTLSDENSVAHFLVSDDQGRDMRISLLKERPEIVMQSDIKSTEATKKALAAMPVKGRQDFHRQIEMELIRFGVEYAVRVRMPTEDEHFVNVLTRLPYDSTVTPSQFWLTLLRLRNAVRLVNQLNDSVSP